MSLETFLENITLEELEELKRLKQSQSKVKTYSFSKMRDKELKELFSIKKALDIDIFDNWFNNDIEISEEIKYFLEELILENRVFIDSYNEEDLKVHFIIPLLNKIKFKSIENNIRDFYENKITYETDDFILNGTTDFLVSKGLFETEKPYFFIQEFKRKEEFSNPRPQLLAELIAGVELNNWNTIKGAYIVGSIWNFVILERIEKYEYQYYVSQNFDSTKIEDLKDIYTNLLFVKNEIIQMVKNGE
jgi:hypothetical protein